MVMVTINGNHQYTRVAGMEALMNIRNTSMVPAIGGTNNGFALKLTLGL